MPRGIALAGWPAARQTDTHAVTTTALRSAGGQVTFELGGAQGD